LYDAAVAGAAPGPVTTAALRDFQARPGQRLWLYAFGKAAHPMAAAAAAALQRSLHTIAGGVIVAPELAASPYATVTALNGDHPLPGRHSFTAAQRIADAADGMRSDDVAIVLLSGGASSLIAAPLRGMSESDLGQLFELLMGSGLDIRAMNTVRKRFTRWGAGRLALALAPARTYAYVMSDVLGDDPADVGSGPCTPDAHTVRDVVELMQKAGIFTRVSPAMRDYLTSVSRGMTPETPKSTHPAFAHVSTRVIGSNHLALDAIAAHARTLPLDVEVVAAPLQGEAARSGTLVADALLQRAQQGRPGCIVWGGETTVQLTPTPPAFAGRNAHAADVPVTGVPPTGGRCQELALSAARTLAHGAEGASRITILAAGTDGRDGPTDSAGAFADASIWSAIRESGRDPELALQRHESHAALATVAALIPRRDTGTNVMDVVIGPSTTD
jgi:glycerate-2-kinase